MLWYFLKWSIEMLLKKHDKPFGTPETVPETLPSFKQRLTNIQKRSCTDYNVPVLSLRHCNTKLLWGKKRPWFKFNK